jgi:hypothetical protein
MHSGLFQRYHACSSGYISHGPCLLSGKLSASGVKLSASGAVVRAVRIEVQCDEMAYQAPSW